MTGVASLLNSILAIVAALLILRLLVGRWTSGGAIVALAIVFLYLLFAFGPVEAMIGGFLMLVAVPALGRSGLGSALKGALIAVTDPIVDAVRRATGGRTGEAVAILLAVIAIFAFRWIVLLPNLPRT